MNENEQARARCIFVDAIQFTGDERTAFVDSACTEDPDLKERVERLLQAYDADASNLGGTRDTVPGKSDPASRDFGRFRMLQKIGEGGFGEVWMAEQTEPVRRRVAIKIIKPGMDSAQVIARFDAERQALALMEHPNIARIYDGGQTEDGRPYFVMELVKGLPITEYCARNKLDLDARVALMRQVCSGVQHAHQKGVIHRDIKPNNVLVGLLDGKPVPKVIDFGIAKALERPLTDKTLFTEFRQFIGTPEYMSPEQADLSLIDVDTRSDVYALGVMLYELLVGSPPFDPGKLRAAGFDEMRRIICEEEPPVPSVKLSRSGAGSGINTFDEEDARLSKLVRGELDWIVQRAMAKERDRRYPSANELEEDLDRYARGEAVRASPPRCLYRVSRFVRRNRVAVYSAISGVAALLVVSILLAIGLVVLSGNYDQLAEAQASERDASTKLQSSLVSRTAALEDVENARAALNRQVVARRLQRASELSVDSQLQAVVELGGIPVDDVNWLSRMLRASLPSKEFSVGAPELPFLEQIVEDSWVLEISRDATRAVCMRLDDTRVFIELVRLDVEPEHAFIADLYSVPRHQSIKSIGALEGIFLNLRWSDQNQVDTVGFSLDGSRVVVSPVILAYMVMISAGGVPFGFPADFDEERLDWMTRVFSVETGGLLCVIDTPRDKSNTALPPIQQMADVLKRFNWACSDDGTRLALLSDGVLAIHDVDEGRQEAIVELEMESTENPILAMSPTGNHVAVIGGDSYASEEKLNLVSVPPSSELIAEEVELSTRPWPGDARGEVQSLAFMQDALLYGVDTNNMLWRIPLELEQHPSDVTSLDIGPPQGDRKRMLLEPLVSSMVTLMNGREFTLVNVEQSMVCARFDLGLGSVSIAEAPDALNSGAINVWTQSQFDRMRLGASVARAVPGGTYGSAGWAPSLVVGSLDYDSYSSMKKAHEADAELMSFKTPFGAHALDELDVVSVSPDGRFLLLFESRDGSYDHGMEILDSRRGERYPVEGLQVPGGYTTYSFGHPSDHCWTEIDGRTLLAASGMQTSSKGGYFIATWDAQSGDLVEESNLSGFLDGDLLAEMDVVLPSSMEAPWANFMQGAVSPDGTYYALSGMVIDRRNFREELERIQRVTTGTSMRVFSVVMIVERVTGRIIEQYVLKGAAGRLAFSPDGSTVATILASDVLAGGMATAITLLPNPDVEGSSGLIQTMGLPGISLDGKGLYIDMGRNQRQILSFSPDGSLLTCALRQSIDLFAVASASHVMRIDWPRLMQMLAPSVDSDGTGIFTDPESEADDPHKAFFAGAAFSPDGSELRVNAGHGAHDVALFRIFDHRSEAAE
jgi:serine/threonine protein kinase